MEVKDTCSFSPPLKKFKTSEDEMEDNDTIMEQDEVSESVYIMYTLKWHVALLLLFIAGFHKYKPFLNCTVLLLFIIVLAN